MCTCAPSAAFSGKHGSSGSLPADELARLLTVKNVGGSNLAAGDPMNPSERGAMFGACDDSPAGIRDRALFAVLYSSGGRVSAVVGVDLADYDPTTGDILFRRVKRDKQQRDQLPLGARDAIAAWLALRGAAPGALFCPVIAGGAVKLRRLDRRSVHAAIQRRCAQAGIRGRSAHDWRHTVATDLDARGVGLRTIQAKLGHANLSTTQRYVHVDADALRRATDMLIVPTIAKR